MQNEELIKALKEDAEWADANEYEVPLTLGDTLREAAAEIRRLTAERDAKWISVKDRLPQFHKMDEYADQLVNVVARGSNGKLYSTSRYYERTRARGKRVERWKYPWGTISEEDIIYWSQIPEPPKEDVCTKN